MSFYQIIWFFLVGILLTVFAILDGFDFGVGVWYLRAKGDKELARLCHRLGCEIIKIGKIHDTASHLSLSRSLRRT